jgi:hypothetical protein
VADNLTAICGCLENVVTSASHDPMGLHSLLQGKLHLLLTEEHAKESHKIHNSKWLQALGHIIPETCDAIYVALKHVNVISDHIIREVFLFHI